MEKNNIVFSLIPKPSRESTVTSNVSEPEIEEKGNVNISEPEIKENENLSEPEIEEYIPKYVKFVQVNYFYKFFHLWLRT